MFNTEKDEFEKAVREHCANSLVPPDLQKNNWGDYEDSLTASMFDGWLLAKQVQDAKMPKSLLRPANEIPKGCYCPPDTCQAPVIMGRQTPCRRKI